MVSTKKFCNIKKIFCKVNKTIQPKALVHSSKKVWSDEQKLVNLIKVLFKINQMQLQNDFVEPTKMFFLLYQL